jgi:rhamnosyltransferase
MVERTAAVIVTFHPDASVFQRINTLAAQVDVLYVIDNTPEEIDLGTWADSIVFFQNRNKGGLAGALNIALREAQKAGIRYFFVFDQDTDMSPDFCNTLLTTALGLEDDTWAIVGPRHVNSSTGHPVRLSVPGRFMNSLWPQETSGVIECLCLINSCSLLDLQKVPKLMRYDEDLAVDMVDVEFCLAIRAAGFKMLCIPAITVAHGIGNRKKGSLAFSATNYSSHRKYLQTRNRFIVWKKFARLETAFVITDAIIWLMDSFRTLAFETKRLDKFKAIFKGVMDGISHRNEHVLRPTR